ncbi:MAG: hypothetical protein DRR42_16670 [Gammaproteobacteria bacterium]|nr:MAG: hypothetical protein DRR42_16670 [Gammaproteobacteria bacterium]
MKTKIRLISKLGLVLTSFLVLFPLAAQAESALTTTYAQDCIPENIGDFRRLENVQGKWQFTGSRTGTATLLCSIDIASTAYKGSQVFLYSDSDGAGNLADVTMAVERFDGVMTHNLGIISSGLTGPGIHSARLNIDSSAGGIWYFRVDLSRSNSNEQAGFFLGILSDTAALN